jgi:myo-inositol-1(or 4)-monophosphatase
MLLPKQSDHPLKSNEIDRRYALAEALIRDAGRMASAQFKRREFLAIDRKGAQDLVSAADRECESLIVETLSRSFPEDGILGEEGASHALGAEAVWVIDPIDGTHNFLSGVPFWCISIGLVVNKESVLGLIYHPAADELFSAKNGRGAFVNGVPMSVSGVTDIARSRICLGFSYRKPISYHVAAIENLLTAGVEYCRLGSGALGLAYTAAGRFDGYWERHLNSWDAAAGICLVREAGGYANDFFSDDGLTRGSEMLATSPKLEKPIKQLVGFGKP